MAHAIEQFLNQANSSTIRCTNTFEIEIVTVYPELDKNMEAAMLFGQEIALPNREIEQAEVAYKGYSMPLVPTKMNMEHEHTIKVLDDIDGTNRRLFLAWMNKTMDADIDGGSVFAGDRGVSNSTIRVILFGKDNETVSQIYRFVGVRVKTVGNISLTYDGGDKSTFDVTFTSLYWKIEKAVDGDYRNQV